MLDKKEIINKVIKKLEKIRDTEQIEEITLTPLEEVQEYRMYDGNTYVKLACNINIEYNHLFQKGDIFDDFIYKEVSNNE